MSRWRRQLAHSPPGPASPPQAHFRMRSGALAAVSTGTVLEEVAGFAADGAVMDARTAGFIGKCQVSKTRRSRRADAATMAGPKRDPMPAARFLPAEGAWADGKERSPFA